MGRSWRVCAQIVINTDVLTDVSLTLRGQQVEQSLRPEIDTIDLLHFPR